MIQKNIVLILLTQHVNSLNMFCTCFAQLQYSLYNFILFYTTYVLSFIIIII